MPRRRPQGWPRYMTAKRLAGGATAYFWAPPTWAKAKGCPLTSEALGSDYGAAKKRCDELLNPQWDDWRAKGEASPAARSTTGSFDWLVSVYRSSPKFKSLTGGTKLDYERALDMVGNFPLKDGRRLGSLALGSITAGVADRLHARIVEGGKGGRHRTAKMAMDVCRRAWNVARRDHPLAVPSLNPFENMEYAYKANVTRAATYNELVAFVAKADELGRPSLGTAAMVAFFWLQRVEDIFTRLAWGDYRPASNPRSVLVWHHKNHGERLPIPLYDTDGTALWPELMARLDAAPRLGTLIVMRDEPDRKRKAHLPWATEAANPIRHVQSVVAEIREAAGLPNEITLTSFRHGGHTDGADAELSDAQMRALGAHKTTAALLRYAKETEKQRVVGARKRLDARTKGGGMSE